MQNVEKKEEFFDWVVYQIYPKSFYDTNGDGIGDLDGVTQKLDYLRLLGVNAIWLCPCYPSPNYDNGYDVSNYRDIAQDFGGMQAWKRLQSQMKKRGMKLIMDLVANHTSSQHAWFIQARSSRDNPYHDYYIWADTPPNDWQSVFGGSAWEYNEQTNEYYLHSFATQQPDLNWKNPKVRQEIRAIIDFWTEMGVDGFRLDVLDFIAKDFANGKMYNGPKFREYVKELFVDTALFTVGECQLGEQDFLRVCGKDGAGLTTVFQFEHFNIGQTNKYLPATFTLDDIKNVLVKWQNFTQENELLYTLFTDNHDNPFFLSRLGLDKKYRYEGATLLAAMFFLLRGIPFIYQGQEFGSVNSTFEKIADFNDVETLNYYRAHSGKTDERQLMQEINRGSRDNPRRPLAWNGDKKKEYGFTTGTAWLKASNHAAKLHLHGDMRAEKSVFAFYKKLLEFRRENESVRYGDFTDLTEGKGYFCYRRRFDNRQVIVCCNFSKTREIKEVVNLEKQGFSFVFGNYNEAQPFSVSFRPYEIAVYQK